MIFYQRIALIPLAVLFTSSTHAAVLDDRCKDNLLGCGILFTSAPPTPSNLSTANCYDPVQVTYTIQNQGTSSTIINMSLVDNDSLDAGDVVIDPSSTCVNGQTLNSMASCNIILDFQPCDAGSLNRSLTVTPTSPQWPITQVLQTTVETSAFVYCPGPVN